MVNLLIFALLPTCTIAFTVLPYIQIDYAHYFRLAQCQAKCAEKYGVATRRQLLDASTEEFVEIQSEEGKMCEYGCQQHRRSHKKVTRSTKSALLEGSRFWMESSADSAKIGTSPVHSVELLCQNPSVNDEIEDSAEGLVGIRLLRSSGPVRYIVQWKQRTHALGEYDESHWITASIESLNRFRVEGLIPGLQYQFKITVVGPNGRLGDTVTSVWSEISGSPVLKIPGGPLIVKNGYNSEQGVTVNLHWPRTAYDSCYHRLEFSNVTQKITRDIIIDSSVSILLTHLEFDSPYSVSIAALPLPRDEQELTPSRALSSKFRSFECSKVHGKGSLNCAPESVADLHVNVRSNGSANISWRASANTDNVLIYQIEYYSTSSKKYGCQTEIQSVYTNSASTTSLIQLDGDNCDYTIRLINYDLLGREAVSEIQTRIERPHLSSFFQWEFVFIALCITLIFFIIILLRCTLSKKCPVRVSEKSAKLTDSYA